MAELFHVGLTVKNLERSVAFYRDVAGMEEHDWRLMNVRSKGFDTLTNNPIVRPEIRQRSPHKF